MASPSSASSGAEALSKLRDDQDYDLVLCDLQMADIDGPELYLRMHTVDAALIPKFVFASGGVFLPKVKTFLANHSVTLLEKPVRREQVLALLEERMGAAAKR